MPRFCGGPNAWGKRFRANVLLVFVIVSTAVASVALLQYFVMGRKAYQPWIAPRPATAAEVLAPGIRAPDFALPLINGQQNVRLADLRRAGKPVVLIFSSFSCDYFTYHQPFLKSLHRDYRDRAEFLMVVVREAEHQLPGLEFLLEEPKDREHRCRLVSRAMDIRQWSIPSVLDTPDALTETVYKAFPLRLVIVNPAGQIDFASRFAGGVFGMDRNAVSRWFETNLGEADLTETSTD